MARKARKGYHSKTEAITIRANPRIKYGLELLSRKQHRTLSSVIEWAIDSALEESTEYLFPENMILSDFWDVQEWKRIAMLAHYAGELLSYEEELLWELIDKHDYFWKGCYDDEGYFTSNYRPGDLIVSRLEAQWSNLKKIAAGELDESVLPERANKPEKHSQENLQQQSG